MTKSKKSVAVAVAVIEYDGRFLLAKRHAHQHQGDKLEFVGGKIEQGESPKAALIREVAEELGVSVADAKIDELGVIDHDYGDKMVSLWVARVLLDQAAFEQLANRAIGLDNQPLFWYELSVLLTLGNQLPAANAPILAWLAK